MATTLAKSLRGDQVGSSLVLRDVYAARPSEPVGDVVRRMADQRTGCVLVLNDGRLEGIFTERDFLSRVVAQGLDVSVPVGQVMTREPKTIARHDSVHKVVELMESGGYRHVPVIGEKGQPIGVLSVKDIVHYLVEYFPAKVYNLPPTPDQTQPAREGA
jgi:CBS domain-containing protein